MRLVLIGWIFCMAVIRLLHYFLYLINASHLFNYILAILILIVYICFRLMFFFTPYEIKLSDIVKKQKNWHITRKNKYYLWFLRIVCIFGSKSGIYYDLYFSKLYIKWHLSRYY